MFFIFLNVVLINRFAVGVYVLFDFMLLYRAT